MNATTTLTASTMPTPTASTPASLVELAESEARRYAAWGDEAGKLFASTMEALAQMLMFTHATTAAEHEARVEVLDDDARQAWEAIGRESAPSTCHRCGGPLD